MSKIVIIDSAYRHGITKESIMSCLYNVRGSKVLDQPPTKRIYAGFDHLANALEIVAIEDEERDCLVVIHAMKLRKKYFYLLRGV